MYALLEPYLALLGIATSAIITIGLASWGAVKLVGERWISNRFNEKLEAFKHAQQQELEHLKFQINASRCAEVHGICVEHNVDLDANGIFMLPELKEKFQNLSTHVWEALSEHKMNYQHELLPRERSKYKALDEQGPVLLSELEKAVRERLWSGVSTGLQAPANFNATAI